MMTHISMLSGSRRNMLELEKHVSGRYRDELIILLKAPQREHYVLCSAVNPEMATMGELNRARDEYWGIYAWQVGSDNEELGWVEEDDDGYAEVYTSLSEAREAMAWILLNR